MEPKILIILYMCFCFRIVLILKKKMEVMMWIKWRIDQNPPPVQKLPDEVVEKVSMEGKRCEETTKD